MATTQKKKKKNRKILLLLFLLFATGTMLGTTSYAWFTSNTTVTVETVNVNVAAQGGIQISADGNIWKGILQNTDITGAYNTYANAKNQLPASMEPISTNGVENAGVLDMYYGKVKMNGNGDLILTSTKEVEKDDHSRQTGTDGTAKYVVFDAFIKYDGTADHAIYLTTTSGVSADGTDLGIKNAARMAFLVLGNTTSTDTVSNIQNLYDTTDPIERDTLIWEPNYNTHTADGITAAQRTYGLTLTPITGETDSYERLSYSGVKAAISETLNTSGMLVGNAKAGYAGYDYTTFLDDMDTTDTNGGNPVSRIDFSTKANYATAGTDGTGSYINLLTVHPGVTKIRIYMWIEGQDVDCENKASGGNVNFNVQFSLNSSATAAGE